MTDPMELLIARALDAAGIRYATDAGGGTDTNLDFHLPDAGIYIEVKRLHSPRIAEQMARAPNVIAAQGDVAVKWLAGLIAPTPEGGVATQASEREGLRDWLVSEVANEIGGCDAEVAGNARRSDNLYVVTAERVVDRILARLPADPDPVKGKLVEAAKRVLRLSEMGFEESMREPEESGNFVAYNRLRAAVSLAEGGSQP